MSEEKYKKFRIGFPFLGLTLGLIDGYIAGHTFVSMIIGGLLGIVLGYIALIGIIPIFGVFLYERIANLIFDYMGHKYLLIYYYGLVLSIIMTITGMLYLLAFIIALIKN